MRPSDTPASRQARNARHYAARRRKHLCMRCGDKLPEGDKHISCKPCREVLSLKRNNGHRKLSSARLAARIVFVAKTSQTHSPARQAQELGISLESVYWIRGKARERGYAIPDAHGFREWAGVAELKDADSCHRCGLRGPHTCLPLHADGGARTGAGRVYPEGPP